MKRYSEDKMILRADDRSYREYASMLDVCRKEKDERGARTAGHHYLCGYVAALEKVRQSIMREAKHDLVRH